MSAQNQAVHRAISEHVHEEFARQSYGWGDFVGLALIDAVFSIRAQYEVKDKFKGVRGRLRTLRSEHESSLLTLSGTASIGEARLSEIMGNSKTGGRTKSSAAIEAAQRLSDASLDTRDLISGNPDLAAKTYKSVKGLGPVTAEYFLMLLGIPGVKADVQITAFVNDALENAGLAAVDSKTAGAIVKEVHASHYKDHEVFSDIRLLDNAIWRYQSSK